MNGYELIAKMRKVRRKYPLTATEQALYNELVAMCNDVEWEDVFNCSNYELCNALQISENTLKDARNKLIQAGLIFYKSGKSKRQHSSYSFSNGLLTTSKFDTDSTPDEAPNTPLSTSKFADYYKQTKLKEVNKESEKNLLPPEIMNTIEFIDRVKQVKLSESEVLNYWAAFNLNEAEKAYFTKEKKVQHFRNWLKNHKNGHAITQTGNKPGTSTKRIEALKEWGA